MNPTNYSSFRGDKPSFFDRYAAVIGSFLSILTSGIVIVSFGVFFKPVSAQFDWSRVETSGAYSLATIMSGLVGITAGRLGDRFNPRLVIVVCGALEGIAYILLSQINSIWQLYFYYGILVGAGMANVVPASSLVARVYQKRRGLMSGIAMAGAPLGSAFAPPLATLLISRYNWSISYIVIGGLALIVTAGAAFCLFHSPQTRPLPRTNPPHASASSRPDTGSPALNKEISFGQVVRSWPFWCFGIIFFCAYFAQQDILVHIVPDATDVGISAANAALILTVVNVVNILGNYSAGLLADRIRSRRTLLISMGLLFTSSLLLIAADRLWVYFIFAALFGLAWGGTSTLRSTVVAELFGLSSHGMITGAVFFIAVIGGTIAPILTGYIFDVSGQYHLAFIIIAILAFLGLMMALLLNYIGRAATSNPESPPSRSKM